MNHQLLRKVQDHINLHRSYFWIAVRTTMDNQALITRCLENQFPKDPRCRVVSVAASVLELTGYKLKKPWYRRETWVVNRLGEKVDPYQAVLKELDMTPEQASRILFIESMPKDIQNLYFKTSTNSLKLARRLSEWIEMMILEDLWFGADRYLKGSNTPQFK